MKTIKSNRSERKYREHLLKNCNPAKIISSLEKRIARDKPKTFMSKIRRWFFKTPEQKHNERTLQYARKTFEQKF